MKCLFCDWNYSAPNPNVTDDDVIDQILLHMETTHDDALDYLEEQLIKAEIKRRNEQENGF